MATLPNQSDGNSDIPKLTIADAVHADVVNPRLIATDENIDAVNAESSATIAEVIAARNGEVDLATRLSLIGTSPGGSFGLDMAFESSITDTDQGVGKVWLNNVDPAAATVLYMDDVDANSANINDYVDSWDDSTTVALRGEIKITKKSDSAVFALYSVTGVVTSASTYSKVAVTFVTGAGSLADTDAVSVGFSRTGDKGATGATGSTGAMGPTGAAGLDMAFESEVTDTDQGVGKVWLNNVNPAAATVLYMDDVDANSANINDYVDSWDDSTTVALRGEIKITKKSDPSVFYLFSVTGVVTSASTYSKVAVTFVTGAGSLADTDAVSVGFSRTGDKGATGTTGATGPQGDPGTTTPEGTDILSTGETGAVKFLREDGDDSCSWQPIPVVNIVDDTTPQLGGDLDGQDKVASKLTFKDTASKTTVVAASGASYAINMENGNVFDITLDQDCTFTFTNPPASPDLGVIVLYLRSVTFTPTFSASIDWRGGTVPTLTANGKDILIFSTVNAGTVYDGSDYSLDSK